MAIETLEEIARALNVSKATVSRALRHCGGVESELRNKILAMAEAGGVTSHGDCDIYCILPQVPSYFWKRAIDAVTLLSGKRRVKLNICTRSSDAETALFYLDEAVRMNARAIVISIQPTPELIRRLEKTASERLVILLSEYYETKNCFYVGGDPTNEGEAVGQLWLEKYSNTSPIILDFYENTNCVLRARAFERVLKDGGIKSRKIPIATDVYNDTLTKTPSKLARLLDGTLGDGRIGIYCPLGGVDISLALYKLKLDPAPISVCHDIDMKSDICMRTSANPLGIKCSAVCMQDIYGQARVAMQAAISYLEDRSLPPSRTIILPPDVYTTKEIF